MTENPAPPAGPPSRRAGLLVPAVILGLLAVCAGPLVYVGVHRSLLESRATAQLDRIAVPRVWTARHPAADSYRGPTFGGDTYATVTREYGLVAAGQDAVVAAAADAVARAGWRVDTDYPEGSGAPSCDFYQGCWSRGGYRLFLTASNDSGTFDTWVSLEITYLP